MVPGSSRTDLRVALPWIVRLRYAMAAGQVITCILVDRFLQIDLPLTLLAVPPAVIAASNLWLARRNRRAAGDVRDLHVVAWIFVLDTLCLTGALVLAGGPTNPFSLLYFVQITLAASILTQRQTWAIGALSCVCFGLLFWVSVPIAALAMSGHGGSARLHLVGMWVAFAVASGLVALFSGRISALLREREQSLLQMKDELARNDRLAGLATLAAGAAHELSTPLATIAVVAKELEHFATCVLPSGAVAEDSRLIRQEVDRCREILQRMSLAGAEPVGESLEQVTVGELADAVVEAFTQRGDLRVEMTDGVRSVTLRVPRHAVEQALVALVKNGLDASVGAHPVLLRGELVESAIRFEVSDSGGGMSEDTLRRVGEPFFTTKEPGQGMGLGVFLVRTLAQRLEGRFELSSKVGTGTSAVLELPCARVAIGVEVRTRA